MNETIPYMFRRQYYSLKKQAIQLENLTSGYKYLRWGLTSVLSLGYILFIVFSHSHYAITYFLYIYILAAFVYFISPKQDTAQQLPVTNDDLADAKNYTREMCEFDFWLTCTGWTMFAFVLCLIPGTDFPVYWPILVIYCVALTVAIIGKELSKWKSMNVDAKSAVKHWVGMNKPKYAK